MEYRSICVLMSPAAVLESVCLGTRPKKPWNSSLYPLCRTHYEPTDLEVEGWSSWSHLPTRAYIVRLSKHSTWNLFQPLSFCSVEHFRIHYHREPCFYTRCGWIEVRCVAGSGLSLLLAPARLTAARLCTFSMAASVGRLTVAVYLSAVRVCCCWMKKLNMRKRLTKVLAGSDGILGKSSSY